MLRRGTGEETIRFAAWLEKVDGTNWEKDMTLAWFTDHNIPTEIRRLLLEKDDNGHDQECNALFAISRTEADLSALKAAADNDESVRYTRARNVEVTKNFDGMPVHRFVVIVSLDVLTRVTAVAFQV